MDDQQASMKMAELAGYTIARFENSKLILFLKEDIAYKTGNIDYEVFENLRLFELQKKAAKWNPKENLAQSMEVLEAMNMDFAIWKSSGSIDPDTGYVMYEVTIGDSYVSLEDTLTEAIFHAVKKYLEPDNDQQPYITGLDIGKGKDIGAKVTIVNGKITGVEYE